MTSLDQRHSAWSGRPWCTRAAWRSPTSPRSPTSATSIGFLGTPPSDTLSCSTRPSWVGAPAPRRWRPRPTSMRWWLTSCTVCRRSQAASSVCCAGGDRVLPPRVVGGHGGGQGGFREERVLQPVERRGHPARRCPGPRAPRRPRRARGRRRRGAPRAAEPVDLRDLGAVHRVLEGRPHRRLRPRGQDRRVDALDGPPPHLRRARAACRACRTGRTARRRTGTPRRSPTRARSLGQVVVVVRGS